MPRRIAVFGGSFNPPGVHHREIALALLPHFDEIHIVPCGPRPDKMTTNDVESIHRATLADLTFRGIPKTQVDLFDLEQATFTRTHRLQELYDGPDREVWHVVGSDLLAGGGNGESFIHRVWEHGPRVWNDLRFVVVERPTFHRAPNDLPPHHELLTIDHPGMSTLIRERVFRHEAFQHLVTPEVAAYIERHALYRGRLPLRTSTVVMEEPKVHLILDESNAKAVSLAARYRDLRSENPDLIIVIGGDGTMLHAIREHWRERRPFLGLNTGYRGFLMNEPSDDELLPPTFAVHQLPLLYVETLGMDGTWRQSLAFNDAWIERDSGQTAWIEVRVDGEQRLSRVVADGMLLATAAGSTAYARAMGAVPLPANTPTLILVGSNVLEPSWKVAHLPLDARVEFLTLDPTKRPVRGYVDGLDQGPVLAMRLRTSRIATVELAFLPDYDMTAKLTKIQFPPSP